MHTNAKISVVIPTYNYAHFLDETIQSVLNQTFQDFELIIVDNHSTDNTDEVVNKYLSDERVSYHKNAKNLGIAGNWNLCIEYANTEYIKFLNADDYFHAELLEKYYTIMSQNPSVSLITCDKQLFGGQPWLVELPLKYLQDGKKVIYHTMATKSWIGEPTSVMFKKSNSHLGNFRPDFGLHIDWEMWNRQLTAGDCYIVPEVLVYIRAHASQATHTLMPTRFFEEYEMAKLLLGYPGFDTPNDKKLISKLIKDKAALCAKEIMYKKLPKIAHKKERDIFVKALKITSREHVFVNGLQLLWKGMRAKTLKKISGKRKKVLQPVGAK